MPRLQASVSFVKFKWAFNIIVLGLQMAARYAANKQINLKKSEAAFRELIERLDCPEEGRSHSS